MIKKKVLVCGASGFIGRNVFETLSRRDDLEVVGTYYTLQPMKKITALIREKKLLWCDLTTREDVKRVVQGVDIVIQCAAVTSGAKDIVNAPYFHVTDTVNMNTLLLEAAFKAHVKHFIFLSCSVMYPMNLDHPVKESDYDPDRKSVV